jgi:hypothetical protein
MNEEDNTGMSDTRASGCCKLNVIMTKTDHWRESMIPTGATFHFSEKVRILFSPYHKENKPSLPLAASAG